MNILGAFSLLIGVVAIWVGDKEPPIKEGPIGKMFKIKSGRMRWMKWLIGLSLMYAGVKLLQS